MMLHIKIVGEERTSTLDVDFVMEEGDTLFTDNGWVGVLGKNGQSIRFRENEEWNKLLRDLVTWLDLADEARNRRAAGLPL